MSGPRYPAAEIHDQGCHCHGCEPWRAEDGRRLTRADVASFQILAGVFVTVALLQVAALILGVPGPLVIFSGV